VEVAGPGWLDQVLIGGERAFLVLYGGLAQSGGACSETGEVLPARTGCSRIVAVDVAGGRPAMAGTVDLPGKVAAGVLDLQPGVLRAAVLHDDRSSGASSPPGELITLDAASPALVDGTTLYATVDGDLVTVDLAAPAAPTMLSRTRIPGATTAPYSNPSVYGVVAGHALVAVARLLMIDVRDPTHPTFVRAIEDGADRTAVRAAPDGRVAIPRGAGGIDIIDLVGNP
jgi:hypothetical protein